MCPELKNLRNKLSFKRFSCCCCCFFFCFFVFCFFLELTIVTGKKFQTLGTCSVLEVCYAALSNAQSYG